MPSTILAIAYAALATLPMMMHIALAAGAPLGRFTAGGRFPCRLPGPWRMLALVQASLLLAMACVVLDRGGALRIGLPDIAFWIVLALTLLTTMANLATPSRPERLLWGPVTIAMSVAAIGIALS